MTTDSEIVNKPLHYTSNPSGIECIEFAERLNFNLGNAFKYLWRHQLKGRPAKDLLKAIWYLEREQQRGCSGPTFYYAFNNTVSYFDKVQMDPELEAIQRAMRLILSSATTTGTKSDLVGAIASIRYHMEQNGYAATE
jgi:Protein of unknwon function (DUF3310)